MRKRATKILKIVIVVIVVAISITALRIYTYSDNSSETQADAAVVLGAAVWSQGVSPVFRERINHAIDLYRRGRVHKIIFTGGQGNRNEPTEAAAARAYAVSNGISPSDILIEQRSHTTYENLVYAKQLADVHGLEKVLIVSDPLHMKRAIAMAHDVGSRRLSIANNDHALHRFAAREKSWRVKPSITSATRSAVLFNQHPLNPRPLL